MDVHSLPFLLLFHPAGHLPAGVVRNLLAGLCYGAVLLVRNIFRDPLTMGVAEAMLLSGMVVAFVAWGGFRLWSFTIGPPLRAFRPAVQAISRLPFWAVAGALGYPLGIIMAKNLHLMEVADVPMKPHILFGGVLVGGMQLLVEGIVLLTRGTRDDENRTAQHHRTAPGV